MLDLEEGELRIPTRVQKDYPTDESPGPAVFRLDREGNLRTVRTIRSYLASRDDDHRALFRSQKNRLSTKSINRAVKAAAEAAGIEPHCFDGRGEPADISSHTLRHSVAWRMLRVEDGNSLYDVRNRLRHSTIQTTEWEYDYFKTI